MCVIIVKPVAEVITRRNLKERWTENPHGAGFMYDANNELKIEKGFFTFRKFYRAFRSAEKAFPSATFVIHMRIATSGLLNEVNCHPFRVKEGLGVAHNGIFTDYTKLKSEFSDTWYFNMDVLMPLSELGDIEYNSATLNLLESYVSRAFSKLVFLNARGDFRIICEDSGEWHEGIWYSNKGLFTQADLPWTSWSQHEKTAPMVACKTCGMLDNPKYMFLRSIRGENHYICYGCAEDVFIKL